MQVGDQKVAKSDVKQLNNGERFTFSWQEVNYTVKTDKKKTRQLLSNMNGQIKSGEVVAIMGGSGAGKSTLLNLLAGRVGAGDITGKILFKGAPRSKKTWKSDCAYVEQDDLLYANLTVEETLMYSARFRLPSSYTNKQRADRVNDVIMELGLNNCRKTVIGNASIRGISGGERKRVSIAVELIATPQILFLDEPTSGLDAFTAFNIIESIKEIAEKQNIIVMMTIHQPRTDIIDLFDKILLVSAGKTLWYGPTRAGLKHFSTLGYDIPPNTNPSDFFLDIITLDQRSPELIMSSTERIEKFRKAFDELPIEKVPETISVKITNGEDQDPSDQTFWITDFVTLLGRNWKLVIRDTPDLMAKAGQVSIMIILLGTLYYQSKFDAPGVQNQVGVLFFICISLSFAIVMPSLALIPAERPITRRERASGAYSCSAMFLSKLVTSVPSALIMACCLCIPTYFLIGFQNTAEKFSIFMFIVFVLSLTANALGFLIASAVPSVQVGQVIGPLVVTVFMLFGGPILNLETCPLVFRWIQYISLISYSNKALVQNQFIGAVMDCSNKKQLCFQSGQMVISTYAVGYPTLWNSVLGNAILGIGFAVVALFLYERSSRPVMRLK